MTIMMVIIIIFDPFVKAKKSPFVRASGLLIRFTAVSSIVGADRNRPRVLSRKRFHFIGELDNIKFPSSSSKKFQRSFGSFDG